MDALIALMCGVFVGAATVGAVKLERTLPDGPVDPPRADERLT